MTANISSSKAVLLIIVALALVVPALAEPGGAPPTPTLSSGTGAPSPETSARTLSVIFVDEHGGWTPAEQARWDEAGSLRVSGMTVVPYARALRAAVVGKLATAQRDSLLRYPEMLLASSRRASFFTVRYVVIDRFKKAGDGRTAPVVYDLEAGGRIPLPRIKEDDPKASLAALSKSLSDGLIRLGAPVWGHVTAKIYHVADCDHVRQAQTIVIGSEQEASRNGYEPCAVCFELDTKVRPKTDAEHTLGREVSSYIERQYRVDADAERQARVERVGRRIVETNGLSDFTYSFRVLDVDVPNAFAAGAGHVYITRGLEKITAGNDDMLAGVLGHEIGHTEEHHVLREYRQAQTWAVIGAVASAATGVYWPGLLTDFVGGLLGRGNGRVFELESDKLGVVYAYSAGYRPDDFILVMNAFKKVAGGKSIPNWLRTHPTEEKRLDRTRALCAQLDALDKVVTGYQTVDAAVATWVRRNSRHFYAHPQGLAEALPVWVAVLGTTPAEPQAANALPSTPSEARPRSSASPAPMDSRSEGTSQGIGAPSGGLPIDDAEGTRVTPGTGDSPTRFSHD